METIVDELSSHLSTLSTKTNEFPLLDNCYPLSTFVLPSMSSCPMVSDGGNHLLIYHHQTLILLRIPTFEILFSISLSQFIETTISDICFYSLENTFLFSSSNRIYSLSSSNKQIQLVQQFPNIIWSITQTSRSIFICYLFGFSIEQWDFTENNITLMKTWPKSDLIEAFDMGINCIRAIDQCLGMSIKGKDFSWRIDVFDVSTMTRIRRGQSIKQENDLHNWIGLIYPIDRFRWLFADGDQGLFLIDQTDENQCKQTKFKQLACNLSLIRNPNNQIISSIIVQTHDGLNSYSI